MPHLHETSSLTRTSRHDKHEVKTAAQYQWINTIFPSCGIDVVLNKHTACFACGGTDRFRCDDRHGHGDYICNQCGAGDGFSLLQKVHGWTFNETLIQVAGILGLHPHYRQPPSHRRQPSSPEINHKAIESLKHSLTCLEPDNGTVGDYLRGRGLMGIGNAAIYSWPHCNHKNGHTYPAMAAPFTNVANQVVGIHRTYLNALTSQKAATTPNKMLTAAPWPGAYRGCAIKLFPAGETLAIAEGIETALAVHQLCGLPVWAAGCSALLKTVEIPAKVKTVQIWADNDINHTGQDAARHLAKRLAATGKAVSIHTPLQVGDWLDILVQRGGAH